jgi:MFS family permease
MSRTHALPAAAAAAPRAQRGTRLALFVIATAQLMLVLDDSIANIALPSIQNDLTISAANLPWVINAYILAFGGLLLFGGRVGDLFGSLVSRSACLCSLKRVLARKISRSKEPTGPRRSHVPQ